MSFSRIPSALLALAFITACAGNTGVSNSGSTFTPQIMQPQTRTAVPAGMARIGSLMHPHYTGAAFSTTYVAMGGLAVFVYTHDFSAGTMTNTRSIGGVDVPTALTVDSSGYLYVANRGNNTITKYNENPGVDNNDPIGTISFQINAPDALAVDANGRLWVANNPSSGCGAIHVYNPSGTTATTVTNGVCNATALAVNDAGTEIAVIDQGNNNVTTYNVNTYALTRTITNGVRGPSALTYDSAGTLYIANAPLNTVSEYLPSGTNFYQKVSSNVSDPVAIAIDNNAGSLWVGNAGSGDITYYDPSTGAQLGAMGPGTTNLTNAFLSVSAFASGNGYIAAIAAATISAVNTSPGVITQQKNWPTHMLCPASAGAYNPAAVASGP